MDIEYIVKDAPERPVETKNDYQRKTYELPKWTESELIWEQKNRKELMK